MASSGKSTTKDSIGTSDKIHLTTTLPNTGDVVIFVDLSYKLSGTLTNVA
jgi:hypothetical protein